MEDIVSERDVFIEVFQLYKDFPCLWDTSHKLYCNRDARKQAFTILTECYSKFEKDATVEDVKKKIENMRAAYRREKRKIDNSKSSGAGTDDVYTPSLWYYPYFTFLNEKQKPGTIGIDNINDDEDSDSDKKAPEKKKARHSYTRKESELFQKQMNLVDATKSLITSSKEQNSADAFGQSVGSQLKELPNSQRWLAEKYIGDILYYAKTGELNRNTAITLNSEQLFQHQPQSHSQRRLSSSHYRTQWPNSPLPNSFSYSSQNQVQSPHSPSPQYHIQSSYSLSDSPSPEHQVQSQHSPSPQYQIKSSYSPSPQNQVQSSHSPSPHYHQLSHPPSRGHKIKSSHSPSSQKQVQTSHSPSPQYHSQSSHSPLPQIQLSHSPSPQVQSSHLPSSQHHRLSSHSPLPQIQLSHSPSPQIQSSHSPSSQHHRLSSHSPLPQIQLPHSPSPQIQSSHSPSPQIQLSHTPSPEIKSSQLLFSQSSHSSNCITNEMQSTKQIHNPSLPQDQSLLFKNESDFSNETLDGSGENRIIRGKIKGLSKILIFKKPK